MNCSPKKLLLLSAILFSTQAHSAEPSTVTVPLDEYMKLVTKDLIAKPTLPSLTVVETAQISGDFGKSLKIRFSGSSMGERKASERLMELNDQYSLTDCSGSAFLKAEGSNLSLIPRADKFNIECNVDVLKWTDLNLTVYNVLSLKSSVKGIKTRIQGRSGVQKTVFFEVPLTELQPVIGDISVVARFRIVVLPEAQNFNYNLELNNPNRGTKAFTIPLLNGESIRRVDFAGRWEEKKDQVIFQVEPGTKRVVIEGALTKKGFTSPFKDSRQYLMIENHPNLQLDLKTSARRVSASDAGLRESFASARTYQINSSETFTWTARTLEIFFSPSLAINSANYRYHLPQEGHPMVQAHFNVENRGVPELPLKVPGKPLYLEVAGRPQVLTKDADGNLLIQLPTGNQSFLVQYEAPSEVNGTFSSISDELIKPAFLISNVSVSVGSGSARGLLLAKGLGEWSSTINWHSLGYVAVAFLLVAFFFGRNLPTSARWTLATMSSLYLFFRPWNFSTFLWLMVFLWAFRNRAMIIDFLRGIYDRLEVVNTWNWKQWARFGGLVFAAWLFFFFLSNSQRHFGNLAGSFDDSRRARGNFASDAPAEPSMLPAAPARKSKNEKVSSMLGKKSDMRQHEDLGAMEESEAQIIGGAGAMTSNFGMDEDKTMSTDSINAAAAIGSDWQGLPAPISIPASTQEFYFSQELLKADQSIKVSGVTILNRWLHPLQWIFIFAGLCFVFIHRNSYRNWLKGNA